MSKIRNSVLYQIDGLVAKMGKIGEMIYRDKYMDAWEEVLDIEKRCIQVKGLIRNLALSGEGESEDELR